MRNLVKGALIGVALVIPGLSASIFAVVVGLYDRLIAAVNNLKREPKTSLRLLLPVGAGAVIGILMSTELTLATTERWPLITYAFFIGLVLGSLPYILSQTVSKVPLTRSIGLIVAGFLTMFALSQLGGDASSSFVAIPRLETVQQAFVLFGAGLFVAALMTIPGISGAIMLMIVNQYGSIYHAASAAGRAGLALFSGRISDFYQFLQSAAVLLPFVVGGLIGFAGGARVMGALLMRFKADVYRVVLGIVLAAVVHLATIAFSVSGAINPLNAMLAIAALILGTYLSKRFD